MKTGTDTADTFREVPERDAEWIFRRRGDHKGRLYQLQCAWTLEPKATPEPSDISQWRLYQQVRKLCHGTTLLRSQEGSLKRQGHRTSQPQPALQHCHRRCGRRRAYRSSLSGVNSLIEQRTVSNGVAFCRGFRRYCCCTCPCSFVLWQLSSGISTFNTSFGKTTPLMSDPTAALWPELQHAICVGLVLPLEAATAHARAMGRRQEAGNFCDHVHICVLSSTALTASEMSFHLLWSVSHY